MPRSPTSQVAVELAKMDKSAGLLSGQDKFFFGQEPAYLCFFFHMYLMHVKSLNKTWNGTTRSCSGPSTHMMAPLPVRGAR